MQRSGWSIIRQCRGFLFPITVSLQGKKKRALLLAMMLVLACLFSGVTEARTVYAPWAMQPQQSYESLVYGSSSMGDVQQLLGPPDDIVSSQQMYPPVQNFYYYDESGNGAATVFVFENGILAGMHYKSPDNQMVDLTYFLPNNGDRLYTMPYNAGYQNYFPYFPMYGVGW